MWKLSPADREERRRRLALIAREAERPKPRRRWTGAEIVSVQSLSNPKQQLTIPGLEKPEVVRALEDWLDGKD